MKIIEMFRNLFYIIEIILVRREMKKRQLRKEIIDMWTVTEMCDLFNFVDPEKYYEQEYWQRDIDSIHRKVDSIIERSVMSMQVPYGPKKKDWLLDELDKDPKDLI